MLFDISVIVPIKITRLTTDSNRENPTKQKKKELNQQTVLQLQNQKSKLSCVVKHLEWMKSLFFFGFCFGYFFLFFALKYSELKPWLGYSQYFVYSILWWVLWLLFLHFVWSWRRSARLVFYSLSKMISFEFGLIYMHVTFNELQSLCWICPFEKKPKKKKK